MCCVFVLKGMEGVPRGDARGPEGAVVELKGAEGVSTQASGGGVQFGYMSTFPPGSRAGGDGRTADVLLLPVRNCGFVTPHGSRVEGRQMY